MLSVHYATMDNGVVSPITYADWQMYLSGGGSPNGSPLFFWLTAAHYFAIGIVAWMLSASVVAISRATSEPVVTPAGIVTFNW